ncbi:MAG: hypothetical protein ACFE0O_09895 [Opitutales bacterium]
MIRKTKTTPINALKICLTAGIWMLLIGFGTSLSAMEHGDRHGPKLHIEVNVPVAWDPITEDDIADAFSTHVRDVFMRDGFKGSIKIHDDAADVDARPRLVIDLQQWEVDRIGNIDCTFTAMLKTDDAVKNLGLFTATSFQWDPVVNQFTLRDDFEEAAEEALQKMYRDLAKSGMIAGFAKS